MSGDTPFVSIVVPARNEGQHIAECLHALLEQDYPADHREIVIVDDGSTDDTAAVAAQFPVMVFSGPPKNAAAARNRGIAKSRGEFIAFTCADCVPHPRWLRELLKGSGDPNVGLLMGQVLGYPSSSLISRYVEENGLLRAQPPGAHPFIANTANVAYRRTVFETLGAFDERVGIADDMDMSWRTRADGRFKVAQNLGAVVYHRHLETARVLFRHYGRCGHGWALVLRKHCVAQGGIKDILAAAGVLVWCLAMAPLRTAYRLISGPRRRRASTFYLTPILDAVRGTAFSLGLISGHALSNTVLKDRQDVT